MLTPNELQIGDWARLRYFDSITGKEVVKDFQVTSITTESPWNHRAVWSSEGNMGHEHIEGLPLTEKILEKNDFQKRSYGWYYKDEDCTIEIKRGSIAIWEGEQDGTYADGLIPLTNSVHNLQQALRLCGLTELANNFKV